MDPRLSLLLELQSVHSEQKEIEDDYQVVPKRRQEIENLLSSIEQTKDEAEKRVTEQEKELHDRELDLKSNQETRAKKEAQLMTIKNEREYQASLAEIESLDRKNARNETRIVELMEGIEKDKKLVENKNEELDQKREQFKEELERLKERESHLLERLEEAKSTTKSVAEKISPDIYQRFIRIYNTRGGLAVVPANTGHCGGCNIKLTPRLMQLVSRGQDLVQCECCNRFLYWEQKQEIDDLSEL